MRNQRVTLVCGPPCSGKTTYVAEHRNPDDLVVDYDDIARRLGSTRTHNHEYRYHQQVEAVIQRVVQAVESGREQRPTWIIRSLPDPQGRAALAEKLGAEVVLLDEPDDVLYDRARARGGDPKTVAAIREWRQQAGGTPQSNTCSISPDA